MATSAPLNLFNADWYLAQNPDVAEAVRLGLITAEQHFQQYGGAEGRAPGPLFNPQDYLVENPDVAAAVNVGLISAYDHFTQFGASEGRSPLSLFDPDFYLRQNPDVAAAVEAGLLTATEHFLLFGQGEPRQINPFINLGAYLNANADLAAASEAGIISPLTHLLTYGAAEGRDLGNGINLSAFANDTAFQNAIAGGDFQQALGRVSDVAPFLPTFEPPAGWQPPADTPIPTDFTPPEGTKLVIPPSVMVPDGQELPDVFEPATPPVPTPPTPPAPPAPGGGDAGGGGVKPDLFFSAVLSEDGETVSFVSKNGTPDYIGVNAYGPELYFSRDGVDYTDLVPWPVPPKGPLTVNLGEVNDVSLSGYFETSAAAGTSGAPRLWLDYGDATRAIMNVDVGYGAAVGIMGSEIKEIVLRGMVEPWFDEDYLDFPDPGHDFGLLQIWDKGDGLAALEKLTLRTDGRVELAAQSAHGILTQPDYLDARFAGALKIDLTDPALFGKVNWKEISTGLHGDAIAIDVRAFKPGTSDIAIYLNDGDDTIHLLGEQNTPGRTIKVNASDGDDVIVFDPAINGLNISGQMDSDTFKVVSNADTATAAVSVTVITDLESSDVLDLTGVTHAKLGLHTALYNGEAEWVKTAVENSGAEVYYLERATVIKLFNSSTPPFETASPLIVLEGTYGNKLPVEIRMTQDQMPDELGAALSALPAGLQPQWWNVDNPEITLYASVSHDVVLDAATYRGGVLMLGGDGKQTFVSGAGDDVMHGGKGADVFKFQSPFGTDIILDFDRSEGDKIDLRDFSTLGNNPAEYTSAYNDRGNYTTITVADNGTITIIGVELTDADILT